MSYEDCRKDGSGAVLGVISVIVILVILGSIGGSSSSPSQPSQESNIAQNTSAIPQSSSTKNTVAGTASEAEITPEKAIIAPSQQVDMAASTRRLETTCVTLEQINKAAIENKKAMLKVESLKSAPDVP